MELNFIEEENFYNPVKIKVVGIGGAGNNMVSWIKDQGIKGAETIALNTDKQQLYYTKADKKILIGENLTKGLGAGGDPKKGELAARESMESIRRALEGAELIYLLAGLGGGTGTGAIPVVAEIAKSLDALTIAVVTLPFRAEGSKRLEKAETALIKLREFADSIIAIDNNKLLKLGKNLPIKQAFALANQIIASMIVGIVETITQPQSFKNLDFADIRAIMERGGVAVVGIGEARGDNRAREAVLKALENPLLDVDYKGAKGALIYVEGDKNLSLEELDTIMQEVHRFLDEESELVIGARVNENLDNKIKVISIVSGVKSPYLIPGKKYTESKERVFMDNGIEEF